MVSKYITKGKGAGRKVIPIKNNEVIKSTQTVTTLTISDLARLLVELMEPDEREDYVQKVIFNKLQNDKAYWSEQSRLHSITDDDDELAYTIIDVDIIAPKEFMKLLLDAKKIELITNKSYYNLVLDKFNNISR